MVRSNYCANAMEPSIFNAQGDYNNLKMEDAHRMKHNLTLNLENSGNNVKRSAKFNAAVVNVNSPALLSSPDAHSFKLSTKDIMNMFPGITQKTPTPSTPLTPSVFVRCLNHVDDYSLESLTTGAQYDPNNLHIDPLKSAVTDLNNGRSIGDPLSNDFINIENQYPATLPSVNTIISHENIAVKEEPQTISSLGSSPRLSPIDMDTQEAIKLERKRSRNRLAASKCRKRKLERIAKLEDKVKSLKGENNELNQLLSRLKAQVYTLKQKVVKHYSHGCIIAHQ